MKKKVLLITLVIASGISIAVSFVPSTTSKDADLKQFLREAGFKNIPSLQSYSVSIEKNWWWDNHGVYFISKGEMDSLCRDNGFIVGPSDRYKEEIPIESAIIMRSNYDKIKGDMLKYSFSRFLGNENYLFTKNEVGLAVKLFESERSWKYLIFRENLKYRLNRKGVKVLNEIYNVNGLDDWSMRKADEYQQIHIVADPRKFNTEGMVLNGILLEHPKPDPIAVIVHRNGYVILAKW